MKTTKRRIWALGISILVYFFLLLLLSCVESTVSQSSIKTFGDAFWYSIVTMTTVGYGDLYSVTLAGRIIGTVFLIISVGILALFFSFVFNLFSGEVIPRIRLRQCKKKPWYIFENNNLESITLAEDILNKKKDAIVIFAANDENISLNKSTRLFSFKQSVVYLLEIGKNVKGIMLVGGDSLSNLKKARQYQKFGVHIYCDTSIEIDSLVNKLTVFNAYSNCARMYWQKYLPDNFVNNIVLIGKGNYGYALLEQALLVNVFEKNRHITYHIFGDSSEFQGLHHQLKQFLSINELAEEKDSIIFHEEEWNQRNDCLCSSDRIIVCTDDDEKNIEIISKLQKYFNLEAQLHIRSLKTVIGYDSSICWFGTAKELYTNEFVLLEELDQIAMAMNNIYRSSNPGAPEWKDLSAFKRNSNIAVADHMYVKIAMLCGKIEKDIITKETCESAFEIYENQKKTRSDEFRYIEHERWMRFHYMYNWEYNEVRDDSNRKHNLLVPFDELSVADQIKDDYAWELMGEMASQL